MSCQQVEMWLVELARGRVTDASARADAEQHLAACALCAARLDEEKFVTDALRTVAAHDANVNAPAHVEAGLLAAFRAQAETETNASAPVFKSARERSFLRSFADRFWPRLALTALAVAVALVLLTVA